MGIGNARPVGPSTSFSRRPAILTIDRCRFIFLSLIVALLFRVFCCREKGCVNKSKASSDPADLTFHGPLVWLDGHTSLYSPVQYNRMACVPH